MWNFMAFCKLSLLLLFRYFCKVAAYINCSAKDGGGICPDGNTCCPVRIINSSASTSPLSSLSLLSSSSATNAISTSVTTGSGCIPSDLGRFVATCCDDGISGCGVGYFCRDSNNDCVEEENEASMSSLAPPISKVSPLSFDPLVKVLPRYQLCTSPEIQYLWGLPITKMLEDVTKTTSATTTKKEASRLAYYSSHGPIENVIFEKENIDMVLIAIHGAGRNADDYFCSISAAVKLQSTYKNVMILAPRFLSESDNAITSTAAAIVNTTRENGYDSAKITATIATPSPSSSFLYWEDLPDGPWRYGANSVGPDQISSYTALDNLVETIWKKKSLSSSPSLFPKKIVIAGHSSGGQMVQRWAFLTSAWKNNEDGLNEHKTIEMKAVVANPSSYLYLSQYRYFDGKWQIPSSSPLLSSKKNYDTNNCPQYNQWEWGLDEGGDFDVPYKKHAIHNISFVIQRYRERRVDYLIGSLDRCNVSTPTGWCDSHGLEVTCMDELQGSNRFERNERYIESLRRAGICHHDHRRVIVPGVGHDHSLMFQSPQGVKSLFDDDDYTNDDGGSDDDGHSANCTNYWDNANIQARQLRGHPPI